MTKCPQCGHRLRIPPEYADQMIRCDRCNSPFVPAQIPTDPPPPITPGKPGRQSKSRRPGGIKFRHFYLIVAGGIGVLASLPQIILTSGIESAIWGILAITSFSLFGMAHIIEAIGLKGDED